MKIKEKTLLYAYFLNNRALLEQDYKRYHGYIRCTDFDIIFLVELMIARVRYDCFKEFSKNVMDLLDLTEEQGDEMLDKWAHK